MLEPLLERGVRFVIRSTGKRTVIDRRGLLGTVKEVAGGCRLRFTAQVIRIEDGKEKACSLQFGAEPIRLPGRKEKMLLVMVVGHLPLPRLPIPGPCNCSWHGEDKKMRKLLQKQGLTT